jgi:transcriptional regulator with XRE-family HTH domain
MDDLARRIRTARTFAELTQPEMAKRLELGEATYKRTELGERRPPRRELLAIADVSDVPMWFLEGGWDGWRGDVDEMARRALEDVGPAGKTVKRRAGER